MGSVAIALPAVKVLLRNLEERSWQPCETSAGGE